MWLASVKNLAQVAFSDRPYSMNRSCSFLFSRHSQVIRVLLKARGEYGMPKYSSNIVRRML